MPSFKMSLSNLFIKFWKFLVLYLGCGCIWLLILRHKWLQVTSYPMPMNKKFEYKDHQKYIPKSWERSVKRKSNHNFIRVIKNHLLTLSMHAVQIFVKILWWRFLVRHWENVSSLKLAVQFYGADLGISTFSMSVY